MGGPPPVSISEIQSFKALDHRLKAIFLLVEENSNEEGVIFKKTSSYRWPTAVFIGCLRSTVAHHDFLHTR